MPRVRHNKVRRLFVQVVPSGQPARPDGWTLHRGSDRQKMIVRAATEFAAQYLPRDARGSFSVDVCHYDDRVEKHPNGAPKTCHVTRVNVVLNGEAPPTTTVEP